MFRRDLDREVLVIVAAAKVLGEGSHKHYDPEVERRLVADVAKDLTGHPTEIIKIVPLAE